MSKELFVTSTPHETKLAVVEDDQLVEVFFERENEYTLAGSIYKGRVTRVLPGMQSAFVDIGLERDAFLYVTDFLEDVEDQDSDFDGVGTQGSPPPRQESAGERTETSGERSEGTERRERNDRNERGGRGGRDRHRRGNRNRPDREQRQPQQVQPTSAPEDANETFAEPNGNLDEMQAQSPASDTGGDSQLGDRGARRWRGRRGRRRGRSQEAPQITPDSALASDEALQEDIDTAAQGFQIGGDFTGEDSGEVTTEVKHSDSEVHSPAQPVSTDEPVSQPSQALRQEDQRREERQTREHFREHTRESRPQNQPRQRVLLPGESLARLNPKVGEAGAAETSAITPASQPEGRFAAKLPTPSTEYRAPINMVAGGVLAGETLSRKRKPAEQQEERSWRTQESQRPAAMQQAPVASEPQAAAPPIEEEVQEEEVQETVAADPPAPVVEVADAREEAAMQEVAGNSQSQPHSQSEREPQQKFSPGEGVVEEEVIEDEEQEESDFREVAEEADFEELEEETLSAEDQKEENFIEAGEGLAAAFAESRDDHQVNAYHGEADDSEIEEGEEVDAAADDFEEMEMQADGEGDDDEGEEEAIADPDDPEYAARAETRAPVGTAAFQQKTDRQGREFKRGTRRERPGRPPMRRGGPRRNIQRGPTPQINDLLKEGQEILVQIAKEPMAKKGARITSHIALPGRFLVFMPTVNHTGVSRKIGSEEERQRLKRILISEKGQNHGGFIVRTAASGASEDDLRADIRFLINLWNEIKNRSESGKAPALIYHDLNLVERILRDQVTSTFSHIWVDSEQEYERILRFASRFQPSLVKRVKLYTKEMPLFEQFNLQEEINKALKSKVWLKSGGYIVINQTEALVAIDINTGKYVGKTARLEDTIVKTNIDAVKEIARQIRLRDLGGIIIIDFIDMDERKNRQKVMQALEEALRNDRSPSKILQFNDFGLVAITRKRVKQSLERTLSTSCGYCTGTGMVKSVSTICNEIFVEMRKMARHFENSQVMLRVNPEVAKALKENAGKRLLEMEELIGSTILVKSDPAQHQEQFDIQ